MGFNKGWINAIIQGDAFEKLQELPDDAIDLIATDPQYGWSFMGKEWDKALPQQEIYDECLRVLKPGAFMFWMSGARLDGLTENGIRIRNAGFKTDFTPIFWVYAVGFPKAEDISLHIDKQECKRELRNKCGKEPTKEEFEKEWENYREVIKREKDRWTGKGNTYQYSQQKEVEREVATVTKPKSNKAKELEGSFGGFQPKPAVEVIIVAMKPLSEKTYVEQALKNGKGITWLDDGRIPFKNGEHPDTVTRKKSKLKQEAIGYVRYDEPLFGGTGHRNGRFPANILVEDDVMNDGKVTKSRAGDVNIEPTNADVQVYGWAKSPKLHKTGAHYDDSGSFSRYFSLDAWFEERVKNLSTLPCFICGHIEEHGNYIDEDGRAYCDECLMSGDYLDVPKLNLKPLPKSMQKTFPFLIVPKASKSERNSGCEGLPIGDPPGSKRSKPAAGRKRALGKSRQNFHPTVKPLKLFTYLVTLASREGDVVLDPFVGSGTTAVACRMLNRNFIGFEINPEYVTIANARLDVEQKTI